jgi:hypothetical protein
MMLPRNRVRLIARVLILLTDICSWQMEPQPTTGASEQCIKCKNSCMKTVSAELLNAAAAYTPVPCTYVTARRTWQYTHLTKLQLASRCLHSVAVLRAVTHYICAMECPFRLICCCSAHAAAYWGVLLKLAIRFWSNCVEASEAQRAGEACSFGERKHLHQRWNGQYVSMNARHNASW